MRARWKTTTIKKTDFRQFTLLVLCQYVIDFVESLCSQATAPVFGRRYLSGKNRFPLVRLGCGVFLDTWRIGVDRLKRDLSGYCLFKHGRKGDHKTPGKNIVLFHSELF